MQSIQNNLLAAIYPYVDTIQKISKKQKARVFLVGGALRDAILGKDVTDFDFAMSCNAISIARSFAKKIKGAFVLLDEEHACARVARKEKGRLFTFDFADFRAATLKGDLSHRDFTINTLSLDIKDLDPLKDFSSYIIDVKKGLSDIRGKNIKMASKKVFVEDPLRLVRAFSLQSLLEFKIEKETLKQIKKDVALVNESAQERIRDEFFKILSTSNAFKNLKQMDKFGLLEQIIPQISIMRYISQGGYHHLPLWAHSLETIHQLEKIFNEFSENQDVSQYLNEELAFGRKRFALLKLAAILHDIGKPETCRKEKGKITYHGHEHAGRCIARHVAKMLKFSLNERKALEHMILYHLRPGYLSNFKKPTAKSVFRYFRDTKQEAVSVLLLSLADQRSTCGPLTTEQDQKHHEKIIRELIVQHFAKKEDKKAPRLLTGDDLIKRLRLKPSPIFKKILLKVEEAQALGKITTKKQALEIAKKMIR